MEKNQKLSGPGRGKTYSNSAKSHGAREAPRGGPKRTLIGEGETKRGTS